MTDVDIGSTTATHADYDVPVGSGEQVRTVPVAKINQIVIAFSENVTNVMTGTVSVVSANTGNNYAISSVSWNAGSFTATYQLASEMIAPDQLILTVTNSVTDIAGNALDSEWTNPTSVSSTATSTFPSGNGSPGSSAGGFKFFFTALPGEYNRNNVGDSADYTVWRNNVGTTSGAAFINGDGDGDGDVDNDDYQIHRSSFGTDFTTW